MLQTFDVPAETGTVVVMTKWPKPGSVKTRLAASIGSERAARVQEIMLRETVARLFSSTRAIRLAVTPDDALGEARRVFPSTRPTGQGAGDLGQRIDRAIRSALAYAHAVVVVGADSPDIPLSIVEEAFERLERVDLVLGPAADGGVYLIGMTQPHDGLFRDVAWGTPSVFGSLEANAARLTLATAILSPWRDVDTLGDLLAWQARDALVRPQ